MFIRNELKHFARARFASGQLLLSERDMVIAAADEIDTLRAENEHLIKILRDIAQALRSGGKDVFADAYLHYIALAVDNAFSGREEGE